MDKKSAVSDTALWQTILGEIELTLSHGSFVTWFKNTRVLRQEENTLTIGVPNIFTKTQLEAKYKPLLQEMLDKNNASDVVLEFKIHSSTATPRKNPQQSEEDIVIVEDVGSSAQQRPSQSSLQVNNSSSVTHSYRQGLNDLYTFDNFIVGGGDRKSVV